jgi:hypothetical protein
VATRAFLIPLSVTLAGCVAQVSAESAARFDRPQTMTVTDQAVALIAPHRTRTFRRCDRPHEYCLSDGYSELAFPKSCPRSLVQHYAADARYHFVGYLHGFATLKLRGRDDLMFMYSESQGLASVYWDYSDSGALVDRGPGKGVDRVAADKFEFRPSGTGALFKCEAPRSS